MTSAIEMVFVGSPVSDDYRVALGEASRVSRSSSTTTSALIPFSLMHVGLVSAITVAKIAIQIMGHRLAVGDFAGLLYRPARIRCDLEYLIENAGYSIGAARFHVNTPVRFLITLQPNPA